MTNETFMAHDKGGFDNSDNATDDAIAGLTPMLEANANRHRHAAIQAAVDQLYALDRALGRMTATGAYIISVLPGILTQVAEGKQPPAEELMAMSQVLHELGDSGQEALRAHHGSHFAAIQAAAVEEYEKLKAAATH